MASWSDPTRGGSARPESQYSYLPVGSSFSSTAHSTPFTYLLPLRSFPPAAQPPHRLSSIDDPYALTLSATASPRQSVASSLNSSPANSYARVAHDDPDHPAMPLNQHQQGYSNMEQPYSNQAFNSSAWLEKEQSRNRRSKWIVSLLFFT